MPQRRVPAIRGRPRGNGTESENEASSPPTTQIDPNVMAAVHQTVNEMLPRIIAQTVEALRQAGEIPNPNTGNPGPEIMVQETHVRNELADIHQWLERFHKQKPHTFTSATTPIETEDWISHLEKIFRVLGCSDRIRVELATYKLEGDANRWWQAWKQSYGGDIVVEDLTWSEFKEIFYQHFTAADKEAYNQEYSTIKQKEDEPVSEYVARFLRLASFAGSTVGTVKNQVHKFIWSLNKNFRPQLITRNFASVAEVADAARDIERESRDSMISHGDNSKKRNRDVFQGSSGGRWVNRTSQWKQPNFKSAVSSQGNSSKGLSNVTPWLRCKDCGFRHRPSPCLRMTGACYNCGQRGHLARDCKQGPKDSNDKDKGKQSTAGGVFGPHYL